MAANQTKKKHGCRGVNLGRGSTAMSDGTLLQFAASEPTLRMRRPNRVVSITPMIVFNVLSAVMPKERAKVLAGYSGKTNAGQLVLGGDVGMMVENVRRRLQETAGVTVADQVAWYVRARGEPENATTDQISASKQIDKLLGYEAAQKVEMNSNHRHEIVAAVAVFRDFNRRTGLNPRQLKVALANHVKGRILASEPTEAEGVQMVSRETKETGDE